MTTEVLEHWGNPRMILVATNLSDETALSMQAVAQARAVGAHVLLVHVVRPPSLRASLEARPHSAITSSRPAAAWEVLHRTATLIEWQGVSCEPVVLEGDPVEAIITLARARDVDRIVVATRSACGVERLIEGSVAEGVMAEASVPVCVVGRHVVATPFVDTGGGRVLLALSLHHNRAAYVQFACELANSRHAGLTLLHVIDARGMKNSLRAMARSMAQARLEGLAAHATRLPGQQKIALREGEPVAEILRESICPGRDLIVMGASSLTPIAKLLGTNIVHRVIADARCPVVTLRPPEVSEAAANETEEELRGIA